MRVAGSFHVDDESWARRPPSFPGQEKSNEKKNGGKVRSQIGQTGNAIAQSPPARSRLVVLRRAVSPACPAKQGRSPAIVPFRPLRGPEGVFEKKTEKDRREAASANP